jgi:hypothetical protein
MECDEVEESWDEHWDYEEGEWIAVLSKGKGGKGKGKGKGKVGFQGKCWNCGEMGHSQLQCPKGWGSAKSSGKSSEFQGYCNACGGWGRSARFCAKAKGKGGKGISELDDDAEEPEEESSQHEISGMTMGGSLDAVINQQVKNKYGNDQQEKGKWKKITITADSGAVAVGPESVARVVKTMSTRASRAGLTYVAANGTQIKNEGQKSLSGMSNEGIPINMVMQVCDVKRVLVLGSVSRFVDAGNKVVFDEGGSCIHNKTSGKTMQLRREGGVYKFDLWVKEGGTKKDTAELGSVGDRKNSVFSGQGEELL